MPSVGDMNNTFLIRLSAIAAALSLVAFTSTAAAGRLQRPLGVGEQPLSAGVHLLDLVSLKQSRPGYKHLPRIAVTLPSGWFNYNGWAVNDGGPLGLAFWDVDKVYPTPCRWQGKPKIDPGRTVDGLARVLATLPLRHASRPRNAELAGFRGKYLRWSVPRKVDFSRCGQGYFESWTGRGWARDRWQQGPGQVDRLWILDVNGKRLVIDANYMPSATRGQRAELDRIVHSIKLLSASSRKTPSAANSQAATSLHWTSKAAPGYQHYYRTHGSPSTVCHKPSALVIRCGNMLARPWDAYRSLSARLLSRTRVRYVWINLDRSRLVATERVRNRAWVA
jgi:hypothetical protein